MEYTQITLTEWIDIKAQLKRELESVTASFVRIGYALRKIKDEELYKNDGYSTLSEFAKKEYGLSASTVSRFMEINERYSIDGYSAELRPEFALYGSSKLSEMLGLPDSDMQMIEPSARREDIRNLKAFNKSDIGGDGNFADIVSKFFEDNKDLLREIYNSPAFKVNSIKAMAEMVNPSGNRSYRSGIFFLMMYENHIMLKKFGSEPEEIKWAQFFDSMKNIYGEELSEETIEEKVVEKEKDIPEEVEGSDSKYESGEVKKEEIAPAKEVISEKKEYKTEIAPAQKSKEITEEKLINKPEELAINQPIKEPTPESIPDVLMSRKQYIDQLTINETVAYITSEYKARRIMSTMLTFPGALEKWLNEKVDAFGKPAE